jgi:hypothetical protein
MDGKLTPEALRRELQDVYDGDHPQASAARERITQAYAALEAELVVDEHLLEERARLIAVIPECDVHGACVPHAIEWVENAIKAEADKQIAVEALEEIASFQFSLPVASDIARQALTRIEEG